jgi:cell wall integrity and stress response component
MRTTTIVAAVLMAATSVAAAVATPVSTAKGVQSPSSFPILDSARSQGCFSTQGELQKIPTPDFMSMGSCTKKCIEKGKLVSGLHGSDCLCGDTYPPASALVEDKFCNYPCPGYDPEACR